MKQSDLRLCQIKIKIIFSSLIVLWASCSSVNERKEVKVSSENSNNYFLVALAELDSCHHRTPFTNSQLNKLFSFFNIGFDTADFYVDDFIEVNDTNRLFIFKPMKGDSLLSIVLSKKRIIDSKKFFYPKASKGHSLHSELWAENDTFSICCINSNDSGGPIMPDDKRIVKKIKFYINQLGKIIVLK